jgi:hypothetical protein
MHYMSLITTSLECYFFSSCYVIECGYHFDALCYFVGWDYNCCTTDRYYTADLLHLGTYYSFVKISVVYRPSAFSICITLW